MIWNIEIISKYSYHKSPHFHLFDPENDSNHIYLQVDQCSVDAVGCCLTMIEHNLPIQNKEIYSINEPRGREDYLRIKQDSDTFILQNGLGSESAGYDNYYQIQKLDLVKILNFMFGHLNQA